jgi:hypothetical protein
MIPPSFTEIVMSTPQDAAAENHDLSSFTLNYNRMTGGFRGRIKVESPFEPGVYVTRGYTTSPIYESEGGKEFARLSVQSGSPNEAAREARLDPADTANAHPGIRFNRVNQGVYFPASDQDVRDAEAEGKRLPAGKAYALMPFLDPDTGIKEPYVVELTAWEPKAKDQGAGIGEQVTWYGGSAKIFDRDAYLAASSKYGSQTERLSEEELDAAPVPGEEPSVIADGGEGPDGAGAREAAGKRAKRRAESGMPKPDDAL